MSIYQKILDKLVHNAPLYIQFIKNINVTIIKSIPNFETSLTQGFIHYSLPVARLSLVDNLFTQVLDNVDNTAIGITMLQDSELLMSNLICNGGTGLHAMGAADIMIDSVSEKEIFKNYSIGLARRTLDFKIFLRYAHNVHTVALITRNVGSLISGTLTKIKTTAKITLRVVIEDMEIFDEVGSIPDVTAYLPPIRYYYENSSGVKSYIFSDVDIPEVPVTFDSKFITSPDSIKKEKLITQQLKQAKGKRDILIEKALDYTLANGHTQEEAVTLISNFFPDFFQHYVVIPENYVVDDTVNMLFANSAKAVFKDEYKPLLISKGIAEGSTAYDLFFSKMDEHIKSFYEEGRFIFPSEMSMPK